MATFLVYEQGLPKQDMQQQDFLENDDVAMHDANEKLRVLPQQQRSRQRAAKIGSFLLGCLPGVLITIGWFCALHFHPYAQHVTTDNSLVGSWKNTINTFENTLLTASGLVGCIIVFLFYIIGMLVAFASNKTRFIALGALLMQVGMIVVGLLTLLHPF